MKVYEVRKFGIENLVQVERADPQPGAKEVVVKFHAVSLNYRDLRFVSGTYNPNARLPAVPFSDGAGEVVAVGADVKRWKSAIAFAPFSRKGGLMDHFPLRSGGLPSAPETWTEFSANTARLTKTD